jgi:benzoyl-CoA reductase/2-hydroxyglutaryl-CoA dehydratase subunit BcrC/BadD/HgdB
VKAVDLLRRKIEDGTARTLLTSAMAHRFLQIFARRETVPNQYGIELVRNAYLKRKPVAFTSLFFPPELATALGLIPFPLEVAAAMISAMNLAPLFLRKAEECWYGSDLCGFHRLATGLMLAGYLPQPSVVLSTTALCDGSHRFFANVAHHFKVPHLLMEIPNGPTEEAEEGVERQLIQMRGALESKLERRARESDWERVFSYSREQHEEMERILEIGAQVPSVVPGEISLNMVGVFYATAGSPWGLRIFRNWRKQLEKTPPRKENYRLFWMHLRPFYAADLFAALRERGAAIVRDEFSAYPWVPLDPRTPERSLARKICANPALGPISRRLAFAVSQVRASKAQGVIHFSHRGCRQAAGGAYLLKEGLRRAGIPCLILDGDCVDPRDYSLEQMRTRVEGFLEML